VTSTISYSELYFGRKYLKKERRWGDTLPERIHAPYQNEDDENTQEEVLLPHEIMQQEKVGEKCDGSEQWVYKEDRFTSAGEFQIQQAEPFPPQAVKMQQKDDFVSPVEDSGEEQKPELEEEENVEREIFSFSELEAVSGEGQQQDSSTNEGARGRDKAGRKKSIAFILLIILFMLLGWLVFQGKMGNDRKLSKNAIDGAYSMQSSLEEWKARLG